jgi:hypothetical protein
MPIYPESWVRCWGRRSGSLMYSNVDRRMNVAYVMNKIMPCLVGSIAVALVGLA